MANKRIKKKWLKKYESIAKQAKEVPIKAVEVNLYPEYIIHPPVNTNEKYLAKDQSYQDALDRVYGGTITALSHYNTSHCSMSFKCNSCGLVFFGKARHMISDKEHQRHECGKVYGTVYGERYLSVSSIKTRRKVKNLSKQREQQFYEMIWNDYSPQEIAQELKVNPNIIKEYFIKEGLIEE